MLLSSPGAHEAVPHFSTRRQHGTSSAETVKQVRQARQGSGWHTDKSTYFSSADSQTLWKGDQSRLEWGCLLDSCSSTGLIWAVGCFWADWQHMSLCTWKNSSGRTFPEFPPCSRLRRALRRAVSPPLPSPRHPATHTPPCWRASLGYDCTVAVPCLSTPG